MGEWEGGRLQERGEFLLQGCGVGLRSDLERESLCS